MTSPRILVVDDDPALLMALPGTFELRLPEVTVDTCGSVAPVVKQITATGLPCRHLRYEYAGYEWLGTAARD